MITNVNCVAFHVTNLDVAHGFYGGVLGLELKEQKGDYYSYRCRDVEIGLELGGKPFIDETSTEVYFQVDDINAWPEKLKKAGVEIVKPIRDEDWSARVITIADPDGNVVHLCQFGTTGKK